MIRPAMLSDRYAVAVMCVLARVSSVVLRCACCWCGAISAVSVAVDGGAGNSAVARRYFRLGLSSARTSTQCAGACSLLVAAGCALVFAPRGGYVSGGLVVLQLSLIHI